MEEKIKVRKAKSGTFKILTIVFVVIGLLALNNAIYLSKETESVIVKRLGAIHTTVYDAGIHVKAPFIDSIERISNQVQLIDIEPSTVYTLDKRTMTVDAYGTYKVVDPLQFKKTVITFDGANEKISNNMFNAIKSIISSLEQDEVIALRGGELSDKIVAKIQAQANSYGIEIVNVDIKRLDLQDTNKAAVYARMISERTAIKTQLESEGQLEKQKIVNDADKQYTELVSEAEAQAQKIKSEGDADYIRIMNTAFGSADRQKLYKIMLRIDALKETIGDGDTLIIDDSSHLLDIINGY